MTEAWDSRKGPFRNFLLRIDGNMDSERNVSKWTLFKALLHGVRTREKKFKALLCRKSFKAVAKHNGVFRALLQLFPDWVI